MRGKAGLWAVSAVLLVAGLLVIGMGLRGPAGPAQPPAWAAAAPAAYHPGPVLPRSTPVEVDVPSIGVKAPLISLGLDGKGAAEVPSADRPGEAGWYKGGPTPGERGPALILGHVDSKEGPAVFYELGRLRPGHRIDVRRADGKVAVFTVESVERVAKDRFPGDRVYGDVRHAGLRLVTCGGTFDKKRRSYRDNIVVYAYQSAVR